MKRWEERKLALEKFDTMDQIDSKYTNIIHKIPHISYNRKVDKEGSGAILMTEGVVRLNEILSLNATRNMLRYTNELLAKSLNEV